jgi:hypothetical protein
MKKLSKILIITVLSVFLVAGTAMALPVNIRPVDVGDCLQKEFDKDDSSYGADISAADDQITTAYWTLTQGSIASNMTLYFEATNPSLSLDAAVAFGIYDLSTEPHLAEVFAAENTAIASAMVSFQDDATVLQWLDSGGLTIEAKTYTFVGTTFGFYIAVGSYDANANAYGYDKVLYSDDTMNEGSGAALLAYNADPGSYIFAGDIDGNGDFCDIITHAESIKPIPEPATMLLLGSGLIGLARFGRKKLLFRKG